jgi:hypothetical protein
MTATPTIRIITTNGIRAELIGSDTCTALGIAVRAGAPVLAMCRRLVAAGHDPATPLVAARGATPCLLVRAIGEAARFEISSSGNGLAPYRPRRRSRGA